MTDDDNQKEKIPFWRDVRMVRILGQILILIVIGIIFLNLGSNLANNFRRLGLTFGFGFLTRPASFDLGNSPIPYHPTSPYTQAILVGLVNSVRVMFFGIILATTIGITVGIGRLSDNWLVRQIAAVYVETIRNTPVLLQLFCWYFAVFLRLPKVENPLIFPGQIFLTNRGVDLPIPAANLQTWLSVALLIVSVIAVVILWRKQTEAILQRGESGTILQGTIVAIAILFMLILLFGLDWQLPQFDRSKKVIEGGINLAPELATLVFGLGVYTAGYIAEVVRAGIQSVDKGQWEAAKALGLNSGLVMRLIIFPQALRVIIPPLTNEYLNLVKNSSLAIAIGYNDIYAISNTISNQTGRSVEMLLVIMGSYLSINLIISLGMNWFNSLVQLKER